MEAVCAVTDGDGDKLSSPCSSLADTRIGLAKGDNVIGCQTVGLCTEVDDWFIQQSIATVHRSKERSTIGVGLC